MAQIKGLLGKKLGMTQLYEEDGTVIPVTVLKAGPCQILQVKGEKEKTDAVQLGFDDCMTEEQWTRVKNWWEKDRKDPKKKKNRRNWKNLTWSEIGQVMKAGVAPKQFIKEVPYEGDEAPKLGDEVTAGIFNEIKMVDVIGKSKGRGFAGTIRRHGFSRGPMTHGSKNVREPGSIGMAAYPARVIKGKRMAGQMGNERVTRRNLKVIRVNEEDGLLIVKGPVPGPNGGYVVIRPSIGER